LIFGSRLRGLFSSQMPFASVGRFAAARGGFLSGVFHPLCPVHFWRIVAHLDNRFRRNQTYVVHLVRVWAKDGQIFNGIIGTVAVKMRDFQNLSDSKAAMDANRRKIIKRQLAIIDALWSHGFLCVVSDAFTMSWSAAFDLASFNAARLPLPLPIATAERMLLKSPLIGGMIFCGLLINVLGLRPFVSIS
jgi:hypothetical protein